MARDHGEIIINITDLKIAAYTMATDTFGTAVDLPEAQTLEVSFEADTDELKAEGYLQYLLSVITHATFKLSGGGVPYAALVVLTGASNTTSVAAPNQIRRQKYSAGGAGLPYFGLIGKMGS